jgi:peptidyl-prolyl cis-trans isomerase B (cyclophilin B)
MTVATNLGEIEITMDLAASPCIAANFTHLASQQFFDGTKCHRMFPGILQCGDPNARGEGYRDTDGQGGPAYRFTSENLPVAQEPPYPAGTVAMANSGSPDTNGSQFFFIYEDLNLPPAYAVIGTITSGLDVLQQVGEAGHDGAFEPNPGGGHPNLEVVIETLQVSDPR